MLACALQAAGAVKAQEGTLTGSSGAVAYASGGVGLEQRTAMAALRGDYNLRLMFATRGSGAMLAGVSLRITDGKGQQVLALDDCGPQVYVRLPAGTYTIAAASGGTEQRRRTTLGKAGAGRDLYFYWHGIAGEH
jgi:hypothetical protein